MFDFGPYPLVGGSQWTLAIRDGAELAFSLQEDGESALLISPCGVSSWEIVADTDGRALNFVPDEAEDLDVECGDAESEYRARIERALRAAERWDQAGSAYLIRGGEELRLERREMD